MLHIYINKYFQKINFAEMQWKMTDLFLMTKDTRYCNNLWPEIHKIPKCKWQNDLHDFISLFILHEDYFWTKDLKNLDIYKLDNNYFNLYIDDTKQFNYELINQIQEKKIRIALQKNNSNKFRALGFQIRNHNYDNGILIPFFNLLIINKKNPQKPKYLLLKSPYFLILDNEKKEEIDLWFENFSNKLNEIADIQKPHFKNNQILDEWDKWRSVCKKY